MARDIDLGDLENLMDNARANMIELLKLYQSDELGVRFTEIYEEETNAPKNKSVAVDIEGFTTDQRTLGNRINTRYSILITANIIYYHSELGERTRKRDVMRIIWRISQMFMQHVTVNGFCSQLGCEVLSTEYTPVVLGQKTMAAGMVRVRLHKLHQVTNAD